MATTSIHPLLEPIVNKILKSEDGLSQESSRELRQLIENQSQQMQSQKFFSDLLVLFSMSAKELLNTDVRDQLSPRYKVAGVIIFDCLTDINDENSSNRRIEISNSLRRVLENDKLSIETNELVFRGAALSMGHIARLAATTDIEFLHNHYLDFSYKLLSAHSENQRSAGAMLISQMTLNCPTLVYGKRKVIFTKIWACVCDKSFFVRCAAAETLELLLKLIAPRDDIAEYCKQVLSVMRECLIPHVPHEKLIGVILFFNIIGDSDALAREKLRESSAQVGLAAHDIIWKFMQKKDSRDVELRNRVMEVMPRLAGVFPQAFVQPNAVTNQNSFLQFFVKHIIETIRQKRERQLAYTTLGNLFNSCFALGNSSITLVQDIMMAVQDGFKEPFCREALQCFAHMVTLSPLCRRYVTQDLVDSLFRGGLTEELIVTLNAIMKNVPLVRNYAQKQLSSQISSVLQRHIVNDNRSHNHVKSAKTSIGASQKFNSAFAINTRTGSRFWSLFNGGTATKDRELSPDEQLTFALKVIASHDFYSINKDVPKDNAPFQIKQTLNQSMNSHDEVKEDPLSSMIAVVRDSVVRYLDDSNPDIRSAAAMSCLAVLDIIIMKLRPGSMDHLSACRILDRLLQQGIGDDSATIRFRIFSNIQPSLDHMIVKSETIFCLLEGLNDESIEVRGATMAVLSRVAHYDPLHIMPIVRLTIERLVKQILHSKEAHLRQESVILLQAVVKGANVLVVPYVTQILSPLITLLNEPSAQVVGAAISTIGELSLAAPEVVQKNSEILRTRLVHALNDQTSLAIREIAVVALGKYMSSVSAHSNEPYTQFTDLFEGLIRAIQTESDEDSLLQLQAMRTAGLLGAVDPVLYIKHRGADNARNNDSRTIKPDHFDDSISWDSSEVVDAPLHEKRMTKIEKYYFAVVISELRDTLLDVSLSSNHQTALSIATKVIRQVGYQAFPFIHEYMDGLILRLNQGDTNVSMRAYILEHLAVLITSIGRQMHHYLSTIIKVVNDFCKEHLQQCLDIVEATYITFLLPDFSVVLRDVISSLLKVLNEELLEENNKKEEVNAKTEANKKKDLSKSTIKVLRLPNTMRLLQSIVNMKDKLGEYRRQFIHIVVSTLDNAQVAAETRVYAIGVLVSLSEELELSEYANRFIHPLIRVIETANSDLVLLGAALTALSTFLCRLGKDFLPFILPIKRVLSNLVIVSIKGSQSQLTGALTGGQAQKDVKILQLEEYEGLVVKLLRQKTLPTNPSDYESIVVHKTLLAAQATASEAVSQIGMQALESAWAISNATTTSPSDVTDWLQRLSTELIRQAPNPIIRLCTPLVKANRASAEQLLNASFNCVWESLYYGDSTDVIDDIPLIAAIETALSSPHVPRDVIVCLLNVAEFMDMQDKRLPIDVTLLAKKAESANMFSRCLRYREIEFNSPNAVPSSECVEALITVNNELGLEDKATGVLLYVASNCPQIEVKPLWLEKLLYWNDARQSYLQQKNMFKKENPNGSPIFHENWMACELGEMRCLYALGEYEELVQSAKSLRLQLDDESAAGVSQSYGHDVNILGASAAWSLGRWEEMNDFVDENLSGDRADVELANKVSFYQAVYNIHSEKYSEALSIIESTRKRLSYAVSTLLSENYSRAYRGMVSMQILSELEEVIEFKQAAAQAAVEIGEFADFNPKSKGAKSGNEVMGSAMNSGGRFDVNAAKDNLLRRWRARLRFAPQEIDVFRHILAVHTLVFEPLEDLDSWLELATLCRKENMFTLCRNTLKSLGSPLLQNVESNPVSGLNSKRMSANFGKHLSQGKVQSTLRKGDRPNDIASNRVLFATFKYFWATGDRERALAELTTFLENTPLNTSTVPGLGSSEPNLPKLKEFRVKCLLKRAEWLREFGNSSFRDVSAAVMEARDLAPHAYQVWHAWAVTNYNQLQQVDISELAQPAVDRGSMSIEINSPRGIPPAPSLPPQTPTRGGTVAASASPISSGPPLPAFSSGPPPSQAASTSRKQLDEKTLKKTKSSDSLKRSAPQGMTLARLLSVGQEADAMRYVSESIRGFVKSIVLGVGQPIAFLLQDTLRLLTLWFTYGSKELIYNLLKVELDKIASENWLRVIPQLIARMHVKSSKIAELLRKLLIKLADSHPQALVCPISVALNTDHDQQKKMAQDVLKEMRKNRSQLVREAALISKELMRVAMTPHEIWHDGLEKAAQQYMEFKDVESMKETLFSLHDAMEEAPAAVSSNALEGFTEDVGRVGMTTLRDVSFRQSYGRVLNEAHVWLKVFAKSGNIADLHQAWEIYQIVFKKIKTQIQSLKKVEMHHVSPDLTNALNLSLAVPGTYNPFQETIGIQSFSNSVDVISSKQRPRKMAMVGSNGVVYQFLLKGHEDLRQDERVMQLFGLINFCFDNARSTSNRGLNIVRYSVLPLSNNSGVIGWVENCDTMNQLIKQYRELKSMRLNIETKLLNNKCQYYIKLPLICKVEAFTAVLEETTGQDLAKMIWLKSKTADTWVERRANFTKSMAVMSMVGYILGLGDRHPSNLMLDRVTGRVVHIDFGDCFEVTMKRAKFPEMVPFRLTRMLTEAMEKTGIEGTYRYTCERVMRVLRDNKDSLMAMLEAFVYDPLISWRLLNEGIEGGNKLSDVEGGWAEGPGSRKKAMVERMADEVNMALPKSRVEGPIKGNKSRNNSIAMPSIVTKAESESDGEDDETGNMNSRALEVIARIQAKLTGRDFAKSSEDEDLTVELQVDRLIKEATSVENLCQLYSGWCPLW